ncbi:LysR family transcriptional regulator [Escherichia coli]|nr:LysR family transcriptional regulator [Escherichia coli]HAO2992602.1 LysR family transcriptional regulator [Escherichia coli]HAW4063555.1 LysR family transcriptional regulator [Escherichia coli]
MAFQVKIHQIRAFVEVARQGSIRGASRMLNMSQPALSKSIQELEEGLAAQLFFRRSKGVTLTDAGESFYQHASLILEELRAAQEDIRQRQGQLVSMINELRQGELDFTINTYYQGPYDHEFTFEKLLEKQFAIFCRPGHPAIGARSIKQLLDYSWTMPTPHGSYYKQLSELLDDQAQTPQVGVVCETFSACISLVAKSDFLSILPEEMGCDPLHGQGLVMLPVSEILPKAAYYLIQRRDSRQTPLTASLITQFRRECGYLQS